MVKVRQRKEMPKQRAEEQERPKLSKFIKKKPKSVKTKKEKNTYQFVGFYERLKRIDVKASHASLVDQNFMFDNLQADNPEDLSQSNFIALIQQEKVNNSTLEFRRVWKELDHLAYSFPLVILNKNKIIAKLLQQLQTDTLKVVYPAIIELVIALIKDMRGDIYEDFLQQILPVVISILDCTDLQLMDAVFSMLSFSFKYLIKPLKEDLVRFYTVFVELLLHKNKFVRKFSAQSFSYVLRKVKFTPQLVELVCTVTSENAVLGVCDLLFEICSGEGDSLHSKSLEVLTSVLEFEHSRSSQHGKLLVRHLYLRLLNTIDTSKQIPMFEILTETLSQLSVSLMVSVINDAVKLKFAKRVTRDLSQHLIKTLQQLMKTECLIEDQILIAESLSLLFYFQFNLCKQIKLFTHQIFKMSDQAVSSFFKLFLLKANQITAESDLNVSKICDIKESNTTVEFSAESHAEKIRHLVPSLNKWTLHDLETRLPLLMTVLQGSQQVFNIELGGTSKQQLEKMIQEASTPTQMYLLSNFVRICTDKTELMTTLRKKIGAVELLELDFKLKLNQNEILNSYEGLNLNDVLKTCSKIIDCYNIGFQDQIAYASHTLIATNFQIDHQNVQSLFVLKQILGKNNNALELKSESDIKTFKNLCINLGKNSRELRITTLQVLSRYEMLDFQPAQNDSPLDIDTIKQFYTGNCSLIPLLLKAEELALSMDSEKQKSNILRRVQLLLSSNMIPDLYVTACYRYAIGCFWVKFSPLHQPAFDILSEIFKQKSYMSLHLNLLENLNYLLQIGGESDDIIKRMQSSISQQRVSDNTTDLTSKLFVRNTVAEQDFVQFKDFVYNMTKSLHTNVDQLLQDQELRNQLMSMYTSFMQFEFGPLNFGRRKTALADFNQTVVASNMTESDEFRAARRTSFNKLFAIYELLGKSSNLNKLSPSQSELLIDNYLELLQTADDRLQKLIVAGLVKCSKKLDFDNKTIKLPKYQKLLEGLCDDNRFSEMIPVIAHGSQIEHDDQQPADEEQKKVKSTESIPKLSQDDRLQVLPVIVKLLFSKLLKKKGQLNKKSLQQRRNIVYQFLSGLEPISEFPIFFKEVLEPLGLTIQDVELDHIRAKLQLVSFSQFIQFVGSVEVIFTQLGSLLNREQYLTSLTNILILMLSQAKRFLGNMKEVDTQEEGLYQYVKRQCRMCVRKGLKIIKQLYSKFNYLSDYMAHLSKLFYQELVQDQVAFFKNNYISDRAQLIEILTTSWSAYTQENYLLFPDVLPALMQMLEVGTKIEPTVFQLHLSMLKNLVVASIDSDSERLRLISLHKGERGEQQQQDSISEKDSADEEEAEPVKFSKVAQEVISTNITVIGQGLYVFWNSHSAKLKSSLVSSKKSSVMNGPQIMAKFQIKEAILLTTAVRDLLFIMSELSSYINTAHTSAVLDGNSFLQMMVGIISQKSLLTATSNFQQKSRTEELLIFGCQSISKLITDSTEDKLLDRINEMFLSMESKKAREVLAKGIYSVFGTPTMQIVVDLNTIKKGLADIDYDFDKVLGGIKAVIELTQAQREFGNLNLLCFCILSLLTHTEYSVREYALHALTVLLPSLDEKLFKKAEGFLLQQLKITRDEMVMRGLLLAVRALVMQSQQSPFKCASQDLSPLINQEHEDFFVQILSMQLPHRLKALRKLQTVQIAPATFLRALLPLVDYLIFEMKTQMENRRNTVRYSRDQSNQLQDEALQVYTTYASKLSWGNYMSLVRKLLYKIEKATRKQNSVAAQKEDGKTEKVICKCLCKVLDGFNFPDVPDAITLLQKTIEEKYHRKSTEIPEYSDFLKEFVGSSILDGFESEKEGDDSLNSDEEEKLGKNVEMLSDKVEDIQAKLQKKVLPLLQRHIIQTKGENTIIRSFVAVSIAKVIRRLPVQQFTLYLHKLINLIVIKGLRTKDLNARDKARKALVKVINEVTPRFLSMILREMQNNLTRGFQLHVYLYTVHYIFNYLKDQMVCGQVTTQMIQIMSPLLLREMFGDLLEEREASDTQKKHIKESKARKAMPIYEVFAQFIDFKTSFLELIQPIVKILEDNPNHSAIQQTEDLLARISNSILKNQSCSGEKLLPFLKQIIEKGVQMSLRTKINDEKAKRDYGAKADADFVLKSKSQLMLETHEVQIKWTKTGQLASDRKTQEICGRVLANFGLQSLKKSLNQKGLILQGDEHDLRDSKSIALKEELVTLLDPFVQPLLDSFKTYYNPIVVQTLQIMVHMIHLGLPTFKTLLKKFINRIFKLFNTSNNADNDFVNSLFRCTSELIKTYSVYNDLSELQVKTLVMIIKANVTNFSTQSSVFVCLKSILYRRFACADLYDLMTTVQEMMVTSVVSSTRTICAQIFTTFILEYPMEEKRLDKHFQHLLKNLTYFDASGRQQLLETLQIIVDKMPEQKLEGWSDLIFLTLFLRLVNESSTKCREIVTEVLRRQLKKTKKRYLDTIFQMQNSSEAMTNGKLQVLALMADCGKLQKEADIVKSVELVSQIISDAAVRDNTRSESEPEEIDLHLHKSGDFLRQIGLESDQEAADQSEESDQWSNVYFGIRCLENIYSKCSQNQAISTAIHSHANLKSDLVLLMWKSGNYWVRLSAVRVLNYLIDQAESAGKMFGTTESILKITYQALSIYNFAYMTQELCKAVANLLVKLIKSVPNVDLVKVYKKASYIGRRILGGKSDSTEVKLGSIVSFYLQSLPYLIDIDALLDCCGPMLELVYRTYTDDQIPSSVKDSSTDLVDQLSSKLNKDSFIKVYNDVQMQITRNRTDRKIKEKMLVTTEVGQIQIQKKRAQKMQKKKLKHKERVLINSLTR